MVMHKIGEDPRQSAYHNRLGGARLTRPVSDLSMGVPQISLADEFRAMLDRWHSLPNDVYDDELDAWYFEKLAEYARKPTDFTFTRYKYFTPSSSGSCPRELYMRIMKAKKSVAAIPPHQGRWKKLGTAIGSFIQRELLFIEKHWKRIFGEEPPFTVERNADGTPRWEDFYSTLTHAPHRGHTITLYGKPDGILRHTATGKRVLLEIKSKQGTPAKTSHSSMRMEDPKHRSQTVGYSIQHGIDDIIVLYVNAAKQAWDMDEEAYAKTPDIRTFDVKPSEDEKIAFLDYPADILDAVTAQTPPPLDLTRWKFNNFKAACALSLSDAEMDALHAQVAQVKASNLKDGDKKKYIQALAEIEAIRDREMTKGAMVA